MNKYLGGNYELKDGKVNVDEGKHSNVDADDVNVGEGQHGNMNVDDVIVGGRQHDDMPKFDMVLFVLFIPEEHIIMVGGNMMLCV